MSASDRMRDFQGLAEEAFRDPHAKYWRAVGLKAQRKCNESESSTGTNE